MSTPQRAHARMSNETRGLWLGLVGVTVFALTLPMTRLATGPANAPQPSPWFLTFARVVIAGGLSAVFLLATRSHWPKPHQLSLIHI